MFNIGVNIHIHDGFAFRNRDDGEGPWLEIADPDEPGTQVVIFFGDIGQMERFALAVAEALRERKRAIVEKLPVTDELLGVAVPNSHEFDIPPKDDTFGFNGL